ncbi:MAG: hypothetical protein JNL23_05825 [Chitinophagaceae bacterium]|nr:hypothetical protein [Chitinophagaceae bacterium]
MKFISEVMSTLYFLRVPGIIFLIGLLARTIGALFKIRHWPYGDELLLAGTIISATGIIIGIIKFILLKKPDQNHK